MARDAIDVDWKLGSFDWVISVWAKETLSYTHHTLCSRTSRISLIEDRHHKRTKKTEEKAKVVAAVLGTKFSQFLAALAILH